MREITVSSYLAKTARKKAFQAGLVISMPLAFTILCWGLEIYVLMPVGFVSILVSVVLCEKLCQSMGVIRRGMQGEDILRSHLKALSLDDQYTAFYNLPIYHENGHISDIDCVLVGPSGLYAFEIKHHNGFIYRRNGAWLQVKVGRRGTPYRGSLTDPSVQLSKNIVKLKKYLEAETKSSMWIHGAIIFTNPNVVLNVDRQPRIPAMQVGEFHSYLNECVKRKIHDMTGIEMALQKLVA